ncbi:Protein of unknown function DUF2500 [Paenibacillus algicola]|uniref:DUF2500 domain-containing protein n=1 Tax=Paenibacillus algicola TaxID=2565926 RepID=A0A4P8XG56_9BACL|nr:Protein of unknown function DUF2500 [Paenibacillus algicola]
MFSDPMDGGFGGGFGGGPGPVFEFIFNVFPIIFGIVFVFILYTIIRSAVQHAKNARAPRESSYARIISKRTEVTGSSRNHHDHHNSSSSRTYYYITLEFDNGERKEYLDVKKLYGLVTEGDTGYAAVQGDWIVDFERELPGRQAGL